LSDCYPAGDAGDRALPAGLPEKPLLAYPTGTGGTLLFGMVEKKGGGRDMAAWYPLILEYEAGASVAEIIAKAGVKSHRFYMVLANLRKMADADKRALRAEAWRRRLAKAEAEFLLGDPGQAKRMLDAHTALVRAAMETEKFEILHDHDARKPVRDETGLSAEEREALRDELRERINRRLAGDAMAVGGRAGE
jgi:hypothetical protein